MKQKIKELFEFKGGVIVNGYPAIHSQVFLANGCLYLKNPGVVMISKSSVDLSGVEEFLRSFVFRPDFNEYLDDLFKLSDGSQLSKFAGQVCYMSLGKGRTLNDDAGKYFDNIKSSGHGSVLEHPNFSFLLYGISRSLTHELVRHRAGFGYSQLSQRYVDSKHSKTLRFVERPEYQQDEYLHNEFIKRIKNISEEYEKIGEYLVEQQRSGIQILTADKKTDLRKKVNQCARSLLPNEVETIMVVTANVRAWRHFIEMRASEHAELEIRELAIRIFLCLYIAEPILFGDYNLVNLVDGTQIIETKYRKV